MRIDEIPKEYLEIIRQLEEMRQARANGELRIQIRVGRPVGFKRSHVGNLSGRR